MVISNTMWAYFASTLKFDHRAMKPLLAWIDSPNIFNKICIDSEHDMKNNFFADNDFVTDSNFEE